MMTPDELIDIRARLEHDNGLEYEDADDLLIEVYIQRDLISDLESERNRLKEALELALPWAKADLSFYGNLEKVQAALKPKEE